MNADDPRHGTTKGFHAGCLDKCCRAAISRYQKTIRNNALQGKRLSVPAVGAQRRIQALMALGWTGTDIAAASKFNHRNDLRRILVGQKGKPCTWLERDTDAAIREVYDRLSMRLPEMTPQRARTRTMAARKGWLPPLAWDDDTIDDPTSGPARVERESVHSSVDWAVVHRFLGGDYGVRATLAERREIVARWTRPMVELERLGWKPERYADSKGEVA